MNKRQKDLIKTANLSEAQIISAIKLEFENALEDIEDKLQLMDLPNMTISQKQRQDFQRMIQKQISAVFTKMDKANVNNLDEFLKLCYEDGFIGAMFDLQGQGIPLAIPLNQEDIVNAIINNTKLTHPIYKALGLDTKALIRAVNAEVARGIMTSSSYIDVARRIQAKAGVPMRRAMTIARTEGHRVRVQATADAQQKAKDLGADVLKQWDSTMDRKTRPTHAELDGQIRELDEPFTIPSTGRKAMAPSGFGVAKEDVNCRCALLQRARWGITDEEFTKMNGDTGELVTLKEKDYARFKKEYQKATETTKP